MPRFPALLLAGLSLSVITGCGSSPDDVASQTANSTQFVCSADKTPLGGMQAYFAPFDPVEREVLCMLDKAQEEVVVGQYNIRRESYLNKLVELKERDVTVKVVVDEGNAARDYNVGDDFLEDMGIDIIRTRPSSRSLMHLKATAIDGTWAMTGSFNWNGTASLANDENMVVIHDPAVAARYREQILEIRGEDEPTVDPAAVTDDTQLLFAPETKLEQPIIDLIDGAQTSIDIAMFTYTRQPITDALVRAMNDRNVTVRVVFERKQLASWSSLDDQLEAAGATVVRAANRIGQYSAMHHKYAIIDGARVITGATNWTKAGTSKSDEDLLVVDEPELAAAFKQNFADLLWVYGGLADETTPAADEAGVMLHANHADTHLGDRVVVTGNHPNLGNWDPWGAIEVQTSASMFPSWTGSTKLPAGTRLEYKFVWITAGGQVLWEPGPNRVLEVPDNGRAVVLSHDFGDTSASRTPRD